MRPGAPGLYPVPPGQTPVPFPSDIHKTPESTGPIGPTTHPAEPQPHGP